MFKGLLCASLLLAAVCSGGLARAQAPQPSPSPPPPAPPCDASAVAATDPLLAQPAIECLRSLGHLVDARTAAIRLLARLENDSLADRQLVEHVRSLLSELDAHTARLTLQLANERSAVRVRLNGADFETALFGVEQRVDPGAYEVRVEAPGRPPALLHFTLGEGQARIVDLWLPEPVQPSPAPLPSPPAPARDAPQTRSLAVPVAAFGLGALGLAVGGAAGIATMTLAPGLSCADARCSGADADTLRRARLLATVSNMGLAAGLVGTSVGVVWLLSPGTPAARRGALPRRLALRVGVGSAALEGLLP